MARIEATTGISFSMPTLNLFNWSRSESVSPTELIWDSEVGTIDQRHIATGTGFVFDEFLFPFAGTVTRLDLGGSSFGALETDIVVTEINVDITDLHIIGTLAQQADAFWSTLLPGDDTLIAGTNGMDVMGDDLFVQAGETLIGGVDHFEANVTAEGFSILFISGEADQVSGGGIIVGEDDTFDLRAAAGTAVRVQGEALLITEGQITGGNDMINLRSGGDEILLFGEVDQVSGDSTITAGDDTIKGSNDQRDTISGDVGSQTDGLTRGGDDDIRGRGGKDILIGDIDEFDGGALRAGDDRIAGGDGNDKLFGDYRKMTGGTIQRDGKDTLLGEDGNDRLEGGPGDDDLAGGNDKDTLLGGTGDDDLQGDGGRDDLQGEEGDDTLNGGSSKDTLLGDQGDDMLTGGGGRDTLNGGKGADLQTGGGGDDSFVYTKTNESKTGNNKADLINDFNPGADVIDLSQIDARTGGGNQAFDFIGNAKFSETKGELRATKGGGETKIQGDTDGDGSADFVIRLTGSFNLEEGDFIL